MAEHLSMNELIKNEIVRSSESLGLPGIRSVDDAPVVCWADQLAATSKAQIDATRHLALSHAFDRTLNRWAPVVSLVVEAPKPTAGAREMTARQMMASPKTARLAHAVHRNRKRV